MDIKTWAEFGALTDEERSALSSEEVEALKTSIAENEVKTAEDREAQSKKDRELAENYKIRAEKAEKKAKGEKGEGDNKPEPKADGLSSKDAIAIARANVHEDDVDELVEFAQFKKISISDAVKHKTWQTLSTERGEERRSAEVANTKRQTGHVSKVTGDTLLEKARRGEAVDEKDVDKLVDARIQSKINGSS